MINDVKTSDYIYKKIAEFNSSERHITPSIKAKLASIQYLKEQVSNVEDNEMEKELLDLTAIYNPQFQQLEDSISKIIRGDSNFELPQSIIDKYNLPQYSKDNIKEIPSYWLTAIKNSRFYIIKEEEEEFLKKLKDISITVHDDNLSYTLSFYFKNNDAFYNDILEKDYFLDKKTKECYKTQASEIKWKNKDEEDKYQYSDFFSIFESFDKNSDKNKIEYQNIEGDRLKNDLIPFSMEFYLNIMDEDNK